MKKTLNDFILGGLFALCANLICLGIFQLIMLTNYGYELALFFITYFAVIPIYFVLFRQRGWRVAVGTLAVHLLITLIITLIGIVLYEPFDNYLEQHYSYFAILAYLGEYIFRVVIGFLAPIIQLIIFAANAVNKRKQNGYLNTQNPP